MRAIWNGAISFGLVNIPVGVYSATHSERISFNYLHQKDLGRIHNVRVCDTCGKEVPYEDLVRGYEYEKGEYVALDEEDFDKIAVESTKTISIMDFVDQDDIDPMFFDTPYYLGPGRNADHVYALFREALLEMIDKKIKGKGGKTKRVTAKKATTNVVDIMSKLKASLKESGVHRKTSAVAKSSKRRSTKTKAA